MTPETKSHWLKEYWPIIITVAGGLLAFGTLRADVADLKDQQAKVATDRELLVRTDERVGRMERDISEMKDDVKEIAKAVK